MHAAKVLYYYDWLNVHKLYTCIIHFSVHFWKYYVHKCVIDIPYLPSKCYAVYIKNKLYLIRYFVI